MRKYFGTDGIRGTVGEYPMTAEFALRLAGAAGAVVMPEGGRVVIGKDPRISSYLFESALEAGFIASGVDVILLSVMPTPGIAYLAQSVGAQLGVVISASHNSYQDNGIKFFDGNGSKLSDDLELKIEAALDEPMVTRSSNRLGRAERLHDAPERYQEFCVSTADRTLSLAGKRVVIDAANGATYKVAPRVFSALGASVVSIGCSPNGRNINQGLGAVYPRLLQRTVRAVEADFGVALDGDGDRLVMVDKHGQLADGDVLLNLLATAAKSSGRLKGPVVGTLMSNLALEQNLKRQGIEFLRSAVGDRHVLKMLRDHGGYLGGETSGHVLCLDKTTTGDGLITAVQVLAALEELGWTLTDALADLRCFPQHMINVKVKDKKRLDVSEAVKCAVQDVETALGNDGRVVLRPSGTEPVVRVMVEGADDERVANFAAQLAQVVEQAAS